MRKLLGLFAGAAMLVAACGGTTSTTAPSAPAASAPAASEPAASAPASAEAPSASAAAEINLFGSTYAAKPGDHGRHGHHR